MSIQKESPVGIPYVIVFLAILGILLSVYAMYDIIAGSFSTTYNISESNVAIWLFVIFLDPTSVLITNKILEISSNSVSFDYVSRLVTSMFGITYLIAAFATFKVKKWVWYLVLFLMSLAIISGIFLIAGYGGQSSIMFPSVSLIISSMILYYLSRPHVKEYFYKKP